MATASIALGSPDTHPMSTTTTASRNLFHRSNKEYSLWFESCSATTTTSQVVTFRFCDEPPSSCLEDHFSVTLEDYLLQTVKHQETALTKFCRDCQNCRNDPETSFDCNSNCETCLYNAQMADNGYIDATKFALCQMISDDDEEPYLYAGPLCSEDGSEITIGVFKDDDCTIPDPTKYVEDYLKDENGYGIKLSYALLRSVYENYNVDCWDITFENWGDCAKDGISCNDPITGEFQKVCENLYTEAETPHIIWTRVIMATPLWIVLVLLLRVLWVINTKDQATNYELVPVKTNPEGKQ